MLTWPLGLLPPTLIHLTLMPERIDLFFYMGKSAQRFDVIDPEEVSNTSQAFSPTRAMLYRC